MSQCPKSAGATTFADGSQKRLESALKFLILRRDYIASH